MQYIIVTMDSKEKKWSNGYLRTRTAMHNTIFLGSPLFIAKALDGYIISIICISITFCIKYPALLKRIIYTTLKINGGCAVFTLHRYEIPYRKWKHRRDG